ncbi:MAG: GxxExxY protein [Thermodesulfobacteriota bacterium]
MQNKLHKAIPPDVEHIVTIILDSAFKVHRALGPGLLENVYEVCLCHELTKAGIKFQRQIELTIIYDGIKLNSGLRLDVLVEEQVVLELKAVESMIPVYEAQILTYLKLTGKRLGLLINFNVPLLKDGIKQIIL